MAALCWCAFLRQHFSAATTQKEILILTVRVGHYGCHLLFGLQVTTTST